MASGAGPSGTRRYQMLGKYRVLAHIATGGMGAVYKAFDEENNRTVAIKVLPPELLAERPALLERFRREARHGGLLRHENIVSLYELGESPSGYFLVMEYVDGIDLAQRLRKGPIDPQDARDLLLQMARALEHAHQHGIVHRDIKPSNILITVQNGRRIAKLTDFGLVRNINEEEHRVTRDGYTVGTVDYISPEQAKDSSAADVRSDMYSLGCTIYHVLAGSPPFEGTLAERIHKRFESEPPSVRKHNPAVPIELSVVLHRMLAPAAKDRFQTPTDLIAALEAPPSETPHEVEAAPSVKMTGPQRIAAGRFDYAQQLLSGGSFREALRVLLECCRLDPFCLNYRRRLRQVQRQQRRALPGEWLAWLGSLRWIGRLQAARKAGNHLKVLEYGEEVLTRRPWHVHTQVTMANAVEALGQSELALWILKHARRKGQSNLVLKRALALIYETQHNYAASIAAWEAVRKSDPNNAEAFQKMRDLSARETIVRGRYQELEDIED